MMINMVTLIIVFTSGSTLLSLLNAWIIVKFISSQPPGRKMVTADITALTFVFGDLLAIANCVGITIRALYGPLPTFGAFLINESLAVLFSLTLASINITAALHIALIFNPR